ncbi:MAG: winged helix DNA-binding domain-containing protein [Acidobacteriota bacterium]|nr:winged helix DNA-binding domain-containing protein [Acidobacteriota bacterium]
MSASVIARRLAAQHLARPASHTAAGVVAWFGAVQAQEYGPARWGIGQRAKGLTDAGVARAFDAGDILRTHIMRPTWHFVAPQDIRWMQALTGPRVRAASGSVLRANELDARLLARSRAVIARALEGGTFLTRQEIRAALARGRIVAETQRLAYIVMDAELDALICSGPRRGSQFTYALVDERAPRAATKDPDESLGELAVRYFQSHGPATVRDFVWWSGLTVREARQAVDIARLAKRDQDGIDYWSVPGDRTVARAGASAHLLPIYDEYVNAYRDRGLLFTSPPGDALFMHYLIVDGRYAGTWRPSENGSGSVTISAGARLSATQKAALAAAVERHAAFYARG